MQIFGFQNAKIGKKWPKRGRKVQFISNSGQKFFYIIKPKIDDFIPKLRPPPPKNTPFFLGGGVRKLNVSYPEDYLTCKKNSKFFYCWIHCKKKFEIFLLLNSLQKKVRKFFTAEFITKKSSKIFNSQF